MSDKFDDIVLKHALELREEYRVIDTRTKLNLLNIGKHGTGKTRLAMTCPKPVFIDSFDRGGVRVAELQPFIESGDILVDASFQDDSWKDPKAFSLWEKKFKERRDMDFFSRLGTYMLDSITTFSSSLMYEILRRGGDKRGSRIGKIPELQDYRDQQYLLVDYLSIMMNLPCHVIVNGHIALFEDIISGGVMTGLLLEGKASDKVPVVFDEKYIAQYYNGKFVLQTQADGRMHAATRVGGGGIFQMYEEQNFRELLKKAGFPYEDKPSLFRKETEGSTIA